VQIAASASKTNLCTAIRATQGKGLMPDGTSRFSHKGKPIFTIWAARPSRILPCCRRSRWRRSAPDAPFDKVCYIGCGVTTGVGAVVNTAKVEPGARVVVFGLGGIGLNVIQGARMVGADKIVGVDLNDSKEMGPPLRHDAFRQSQEGRRRYRASIWSI
jgi:S-(hydroxymethyl)glutathione dehydrogenase/alcohol dehydrogenase